MTVPNNPSRDEILASYRDLLDFLDANPDVPVGRSEPNEYCIGGNDDEAGMAELRRVADILGVEITSSPDSTHFYATRPFGRVRYRAFYVTNASMEAYDEEQRHLRVRREKSRSESGEVSGE